METGEIKIIIFIEWEEMQQVVVSLVILLVPLCWSKPSIAEKACPNESTAILISLQGDASFATNARGTWQNAQLNQTICEDSRVWVKPNSRVSLLLPGNDVVRLNENTVLTLNAITRDKPSLLNVIKGFLHYLSRKPREVKIESGIANAAPLGTEFAFSVDNGKASLWVYEGDVRFFNPQGSITLKPGQAAQAQLGQAPRFQIDLKPQDAVNWALYYPPLLPYPQDIKQIDPTLGMAIQEFRQGRIDTALARLNTFSQGQQTPYFHKIRAAMRLILGQVELAGQDIQSIQAQKTNDADALALQSVLALTQNHKDEAYALANRAIASDPRSATAYSALSYAEQGRFQLDKALVAAEQAVTLAPHDAMVVARKAELELAQGLTAKSDETAQQALSLDANLERTQTISGFSQLLKMDTDKAVQSFTKAIQLDSTSPLARLGLGLAKIRNGDLAEGRQDIEIAAILDPNNSLIRSYLGKAYYEEKRSTLAEDQYSLAKQRDPKDPTPYFYDAIQRQTTNRPVEALQDMQKAIELNDNRGVYRSKLMLDSDSAARSASLGRIYNDLGFQQRGLLEGWNSVNADPSNYSAHRFLSDNYAVLPRHEIARVSELLKAQLLQPINLTPVQPQVAESNILILDGLGSSITSFNDYNSAFIRNRFALQATGYYGGNNTKSDEVVHSGVWNRLSYSIGQFHYQTDGYRPNNKQENDIYNFFGQLKVAKDTNLQLEIRSAEQKFGDINQGFFYKSVFTR